MTGNMSYLSDFMLFDGGYATFGGGAKGGKITGKGTLKTSKLDFEDVYFVKELYKAFRVYNIRTRKVEENLHIRFLEYKPIIVSDGPKWLFDIDVLTKSMNYVPVVACTNSNDLVGTEESIGTSHSSKETASSQDYILMPLRKDGSLFDSSSKNANNDEPQPSSGAKKKDDEVQSYYGRLNINTISPIVTTAPLEATHADFFSDETELDMSNITTTYLVPSTPNTKIHKDHSLDHVIDPSWIEAMQDELLQFKLQKVWTLVDLPFGKRAIGTKWVYKNKKDERGIMIRNKARLVAQGYTQEERIDYDEMDVKSAFLYGKIEEEFYVYQPPWFEDPEFLDRVYKVERALYGLHQAPRAWYETLSTYLLENGFQRGHIDKTLFIKRVKGDILLVQVYVDDIIFGSIRNEMCTEFEKMMHKKFQLSSMGELTFFLRLQVSQKDDGIFINQDKEYVVAASCCGQVLWIQNQMLDYGYNFMNTKIYIDNESTICIVKNPVFHSKTKHIEIRHHFIRDSNEKKLIQMSKIHTDHNVVDLLTKAFDVGRFQYLIATNETVIKEWEDRIERAAIAASCLEAEQDSGSGLGCQDTTLGGAEAQIRFETVSKQSNDPPLSRVNTLGSVEDIMKLKELMDLCTKLPEKFLNTATARTLDNGEIEITATIDGKVKIVSEASIRRHLKLEDYYGISNLPTKFLSNLLLWVFLNKHKRLLLHHNRTYIAPTLTQKLFSNIRRASKGYIRVDIPLFPTMLVQGLVVQGKGSTVPVESHHTPTSAPSTLQPPSLSPSRRTTRQEFVVPQPRSPTQTNVADEAASTGVDVKHRGAATTVTNLDVGHGSDLQPTNKVYGTAFTKLIKKVTKLEKTAKTRQARRKARTIVSDDEEDLEDPSKQEWKIAEINQHLDISLVQHNAEVQGRHEHDMESDFDFTAAEEVYTAEKEVSTVEPVSTAGALVSTAGVSSAKDKAIDVEERQRIARVQEEASSLNIEEWDDIQARVEADEEFA
ncbi:putative ribonuclease H-like domain-containing protein [Tanacetum coccineum]